MTPSNTANRNFNLFFPIYCPTPSANKPIQSKEGMRKYKAGVQTAPHEVSPAQKTLLA